MRRMLMSAPALLFFLSLPLTGYASSLFISCGVQGAKVLVDSRETATTDTNGEVYIDNVTLGKHAVSIVKDGYGAHTDSITVKEKLTSFVTATLKRQDTAPPEIMVLSPASSRGIKAVVRENTVEFVGLVRDESAISSVSVNGQPAALARPSGDEQQRFPGANVVKFTARVNLPAGDNTIKIESLDEAGNRGTLNQVVERQAQSIAKTVGMDCHAILIGIDDYQYWPDLTNPINDMSTLANDLTENYGFAAKVLKNPTKSEILSNIRNYYTREFSENSELLIVVAGHGYFDEDSKTGYFVAIDGKKTKEDPNFETYIDYLNLQQLITNIKCKHILLVLDACFSGTANIQIAKRGEDDTYKDLPKEEFILRKLQYQTRKVITSGGKDYVPDGRPNSHSPFM